MTTCLQCSYSAGMPVAITIRNVPDDVRDELAARAARSGQSLQEYLAGHLEEMATRPDVADAVLAARTRARTAGRVFGAAEIVAERDADRA